MCSNNDSKYMKIMHINVFIGGIATWDMQGRPLVL